MEGSDSLLGALSFRTVEFQVTALHTHEYLYCKASIDVNATVMSQSWYRMKGLCLAHGVVAFGAEFDLDFRISLAQTRHMYLIIFHLLMKISPTAIQKREFGRCVQNYTKLSLVPFSWLIGSWRSTEDPLYELP